MPRKGSPGVIDFCVVLSCFTTGDAAAGVAWRANAGESLSRPQGDFCYLLFGVVLAILSRHGVNSGLNLLVHIWCKLRLQLACGCWRMYRVKGTVVTS